MQLRSDDDGASPWPCAFDSGGVGCALGIGDADARADTGPDDLAQIKVRTECPRDGDLVCLLSPDGTS